MSIFNSMRKFMGLDDDEDMYEDEFDYEEEKDERVIPMEINRAKRNARSEVIPIQRSHNKVINIVKPKSFENTTTIAEDLRAGVTSLVNTNGLEKKEAQRLLDFLCGAAYVLDGLVQEVETGVFVVSPTEITVNSLLRDGLKEKTETASFINWNIK